MGFPELVVLIDSHKFSLHGSYRFPYINFGFYRFYDHDRDVMITSYTDKAIFSFTVRIP